MIVRKFSENVTKAFSNKQYTSFVDLSRAIAKKSLERVDSDCVSFGVLDSSIIYNHVAAGFEMFPFLQLYPIINQYFSFFTDMVL